MPEELVLEYLVKIMRETCLASVPPYPLTPSMTRETAFMGIRPATLYSPQLSKLRYILAKLVLFVGQLVFFDTVQYISTEGAHKKKPAQPH